MLLPHWLDGFYRRLFPHWFSGRARRRRFRPHQRRRPELSLIPAYVDVLEERVLLSSFAIGTETLVNGTIPGDQKFSTQTDRSFTATPDGGALLAWTSTTPIAAGVSSQTTTSSTSQTASSSSSQTIVARFVDALGKPAGGEFQVSAGPCQSAGNAVVGAAGGGRYVIAWEATGDSLDKSGAGIFARIYSSNGTPVTSEFRVAQTTSGDQKAPSVVLISPTSFAVVWSGAGSNKSTGVYARVFNNAGTALTNEIRVPSTTKGGQQDACVMSLPGGGFIVAWSGNGTGDTAGVFARRFDAAGKPIGSEFLVNSSTAGTQAHPAIAMNHERGIVIAWEGTGCNLDGSGAGVFARRFSLAGVSQGNEFLVSDMTNGDQKDPSIVWLPAGGFAVAWSGNGVGDADGVFVREFENNGTPRGPSQRVNTTTTGNQAFPTIRVRGAGYTIDWSGTGIGDSSGVFLQAFGSGDNILPSVTARLANDTGTSSTDGITSDPTVTGTAADNIGVTLLEAALDLRNGNPVYRNITHKLSNGGYTLTSADLFGLLPTLQPLSAQALPGLPDGAYTLLVRGRDNAGNTSPLATLVFTLDTTPPAAPTVDLPNESDTGESPTDNLTSRTTYTLTGNAESGALVRLNRNGQPAGQTTANSPWQIAQSGLTDGSYLYTATAQDVAGNVSDTSASLTVVVDTLISAPTAALVNDTGTSSSDRLTKDPTVQGTASDPHGIALLEAAIVGGIQPADVGAAGTLPFQNITGKLVNGTYTLTAGDLAALHGGLLPDGDYALKVRARDTAGNLSITTTLTFTLDTLIPAPTAALQNDTGTSGSDRLTRDATIQGTASDPHGIALLEGAIVGGIQPAEVGALEALPFQNITSKLANGTCILTASDLAALNGGTLPDGDYRFSVRSRDQAGNVSGITTLAFSLDTIAPESPSVDLPAESDTGVDPADNLTKQTAFTLTGEAESGALVRLFRNGQSAGETTANSPWQIAQSGLSEGSHVYTATAQDAAGNVSNPGAPLTVVVDTIAPVVSIDLAPDSDTEPAGDHKTSLDAVSLLGTTEQGLNVRLSPGGLQQLADSAGQFRFDNVPLAVGNNLFTASATDAAGNIGQMSATVTRISVIAAPTAALQNDTGTSNSDRLTSDPTVQGTASDPNGIAALEAAFDTGGPLVFQNVTSKLVGGSYVLTTSDLAGVFGGQLTDGVYALTVRARDSAGNVSTNALLTFTLDTVSPTTTVTAPQPGLVTDQNITITGQVTDDRSGVASLEGAVDGGSFVPIPFDGSGNFSLSTSFALDGSADGTHTIHLRGTDIAGNVSGLSDVAFELVTNANSLALVEGTAFHVIQSVDLTIPAQPTELVFSFDGLVFDTQSQGTIKDAFEVAFLDANNRSLVQTIGIGRDAFFNITEGQAPDLAPGVSLANTTVTVSLAGLQPGTIGTLIFRLVNNDRDTTTSVRVTDFHLQNSSNTTPPLSSASLPARDQGLPIDFNSLSDVTSGFFANYSQTMFDEDDNSLLTDLGIKNLGTYPVKAPLVVVIEHLSDPSVFVVDPDGFTSAGDPFFNYSGLFAGTTIESGDESGVLTLVFHNAQRTQFTYDLRVLGQLNRPPVITSQPATEALPGRPYVYQATAADADNDPLTFSLLAGPAGMTVDSASGLISWTPQLSDLGNQDVLLEVTDGHGGVTQQRYTIATIAAPPNRPPLFTSTPLIEAFVNTPYTYRATASDPDHDALSFTLTSGPAGMSIDAATGLVSWQPQGNQTGTQNVVLSVNDGNGGTALQAYQIMSGAEPGNTSPVIISQPVLSFDVPRFPNASSGDVNPASLNLDLGRGDSVTKSVSLTLPSAPPVPPPPRQSFALALGSTVSGAIGESFAQDDYNFTLTARSLLYFDSLTNNGNLAWTLVGPAGTAVSNRTFSTPENSNPVLNLVAGNYTLSVVGVEDSTGTYQFRLSDLNSATSLTPGTPVSGSLDPANETDIYRFSASAGDRFYFDAQAQSTGASASWRLIDPFGNALFNLNSGSTLIDVDVLTLAQPGSYALLLEGPIGSAVANTYTINVQPAPINTTPLTLGQTVSAAIATAGDTDRYTFSLTQASLLYFDSLTNSNIPSWTLSGPAGTAVNARPFNSAENGNPILNLSAGSYTLNIDALGDSTPAYSFRLFDLAAATELTPSTPVSGELNPANESDLFRFTAAAGDRFSFDLTTRTNAGGSRWRLVDPYGNSGFNTTFTSTTSSDVATLTLAQPGSYTLLLEGALSDTLSGSYTFNVVPQGNTPQPPLTGAALTLGTTVSDTISVAGEQDRYIFTLAQASLLYFDALTNNSNLNWSLIGPAGISVSNRSFTASEGGSILSGNPVLNLVGGTYQLTVAATGSATGAYQFRLSDLAQASPLTPGTPLSDQLSPANETDLYRFTAAAGDRFFFDVQARTGASNARWRLVDPFGNSIFNTSFNSTNIFSDADTTTLTQAGNYALLLEGHIVDTGTGAYTVNVQPVTTDRQALPLGNVVSGSIGATGEQDEYTFSLAQPALLYFDSLTFDSGQSLNWSLVGPAGNAVAARSLNSSDSASFLSNPVLNLVAGNYTLTMDGFGDATGAYQFRLLNLAEATPFTPGTPVSGTLNPANETDLLQFTAAAGDRFFFDVTARSGGSQSLWRLVDPYGNILFNTSFSTTTSSSDVDVLTLPQAGRYTLLLEGAVTVTAADSYTFNVQPVASPSSQAMALGSVVGGSIGLAGEQDQFTFTLAAPVLAYFDSLSNQTNMNWSLTSTAGAMLVTRQTFSASDDGSLSGNPVLNLGAGTYTLTVDGLGDATGAYQFRLLNLAEATPLTPGTPVNGTLTPANETDIFQFTAAAGDKFFFDVQARTGSNASSWRLVDPARTVLFNKQFSDTSSFSDVDTLTLAQAGQYTLLVEGAVGNPGTSTYTFNVQPVTFVSQPLTLGSLVNGSIGVPGEQDLYTFSLAAPALLYFDGLSNSGSWALTGPAGTVMSNQSFATGNQQVLNLIAGDYTLAVDGSSDTTGLYRFRLSDLAQATSLTPGTPVSGTLNPFDETDLFQFTATAGDQFFFDVQARSGANSAGWRLADPYGNILFSKSFNSTTSSDVATMTLTQPGNYTLLLEGFVFDSGSGSYTFNVQPMGNVPQPPPTGAPLTLGTTVSDSIAVAGEQDHYLFTLTTASMLYFDALTDNSNLTWTLVGPAGAAVSNRSFANSDASSLNGNPVLNLVAGTYQLTIAASGSSTGPYEFRLSDLAQATPFTPGTPISGDLNPGPETDLYRFSVATAGRYAFDFLNRTTTANFRLNLRVIDPYGNVVSVSPFASNPDRQALNLERSGTYTLLVEGGVFNSGAGTYSLGVRRTPSVFAHGDLFVALDGTFERFDQDLNFLDILNTQTSSLLTGMAFDSSDRLYVTNFGSSTISRFDASGTLIAPNPFVSVDPDGNGESIVFDAAGNFYVGQAGPNGPTGTKDILKFSPDGVLLDRFDVLREDRGSDWIDLAADQTTMFYTSEDKHILRYDLNTHTQLPSFAKLPSRAYALRILPDKSVLVAASDRIVHLDQTGQTIRTYTVPGVTDFFSLNLDPDGTSFWAAPTLSGLFPNSINDTVYKFDISSGSILKSRRIPGARIGGVTVFGEIVAGTSRIDVIADDPAPIFANLSGEVAGIPGQSSTFQVKFTGDGDAHSFDLLFVRPESNLLLGSIPVTINKQYLYPVRAVDADGDPITFSLLEAPADAAINPQTGRITFAPPSVGTYRFVVQADDGRGGRDVQKYDVVVTSGAPNLPPAITSTAPDEATAGLPFEYRAVATDPDGDLLTYFLTQAPEGMAIDRLTGLITWTPTPSQIGSQTATIRVRDGRGGEETQTFTLSVFADTGNRAPRMVSAPITAAVSDKLYRYSAFATDEDNDPLRFDVVVAPDGMTVDATSGVIIWRPNAGDVGDNDVILRVRDGRGGVNLQSFQITVNAVGTPPCFSTPAPRASAVVDQPYQYQFRTQDADGDAVTYRLDASPAGMTIDPTTGLLHWKPGVGQVGSHTVIVTAIDSTLALVKRSFALEVLPSASNDPPVITLSPRTSIGLGATYLYQVAASDPNNDPLTVNLLTAPAGMTLDADHLLRWNSEAGQLGDNNVVIRVEDGRGGIVSQSFTVEVATQRANQTPQIVSSPLLTATVGRDYHHQPRGIDTDGDPLFWSLKTFPEGMSVHPALGTLCWTPSADQVGLNSVVVQLDDGQGGFSTQSFTVVVRAVNLPPMFVSTPFTNGTVGRPYAYAARAEDVEGDPLDFQLTTSPEGMTINAATGLIDWTPTTAQLGPQNVAIQVTDGQGGNATQTFTIVVAPVPPNQPPTITTLPITAAATGLAYTYDVDAADPEGDPLTFALETPPAGMTIDSATGLINWMPADNQAGNQRITLKVTDSSGKTASQAYTLRVQVANRAPVIHSVAVLSTTAGLVYRYDVKASDPDGNALTYSLTSPPPGMTIDALGRITWATAIPDIATHPVTVVVTDVFGASALQTYDLIVTADTEAPQVELLLSVNPADLGTTVTVAVNAVDNVHVTSLTLTNNGVAVPLDTFGRATISGATAGFFNLFATARDAAGNVGTASDTLIVYDPHVTGAPVVDLTVPADNAVVTTFADIIGTVQDANLISYTLAVAPLGSDSFTDFFTGTSEVTNGVLGTFDPTMLRNDTYVIRLTAINTGGFSASVETTVHVSQSLKLGNFTLSFNDLGIPVSGIPITVTRTYDTLTAGREGEFGFGWRLEFRDADLRTSVTPTQYEKDGIYNPFKVGTRVYLTMPGGTREGFTFQPKLASGFRGSFIGIFEPQFVPDDGVTSSLTVTPADLRIGADGRVFDFRTGLAYNPASSLFGASYLLTTEEGLAYDIDGNSGLLRKVSDTNNNTLKFSDSGIVSSTGVSVTFERDAQGRIAAVVDPAANRILYEYDAASNLVAVTDRRGNTTQFVYRASPAHFLDQVIDPLGRVGVRTDYDALGRLIKLIDAAGNSAQFSYDPSHLLETFTDQRGFSTTYEYDARGNIVRQIDPLGAVTLRTFDADNNRLTETDPLGRTTTFTYNDRGDALTKVDPLGHVTISTYQAFTWGTTALAATRGEAAAPFTRLTTSTDPLGNTIRNGYDFFGDLIAQTDPLGNSTTLSLDDAGNPVVFTDQLGNATQNEYDGNGFRTKSVDANGHVLQYGNDANGNPLSQTTADGGGWNLTYDADGMPTVVGPIGLQNAVQYDALSQITRLTDPSGQTVVLDYDALGHMTQMTLPDGTIAARRIYDPLGNLVSATDSLGNVTGYAYDGNGQLVLTTFPDGSTEKRKYNLAGELIEVTDALGNSTHYVYDGAGRQIQVIDALGGVAGTTYDAADRIVAVTDPLGRTTRFQFDAAGRQIATIAPDGSTTKNVYDAIGRLVQTIDAAGNITRHAYDLVGNLVSVTDAIGNVTRYGYDDNNQRVSITDAKGNITHFRYDTQRHLVETTQPEGETNGSTYDSFGRLASTTNGKGETIGYSYDARGRLTTLTLPGGSLETYTYTSDGLTSTVTDASGTTRYDYDPVMRRLVRVTQPDGRYIRYAYDALGRRTLMAHSMAAGLSEDVTQYAYDALGRLTRVTDPQGGVTTYTYDAAGNQKTTTLPNGVITTVTYDSLNRVVSIVDESGSGATIGSFIYTLDANGNRIKETNADGSYHVYAYDPLNRVIGEEHFNSSGVSTGAETYTYDAVGNLIARTGTLLGSATFTYNRNNQLVVGAGSTYVYDPAGNQVSVTDGAGAVTRYSYDARRRLTSSQAPDGTITSYTYDHEGVRQSQQGPAGLVKYLVDAANGPGSAQVVRESDSAGATLRTYVLGTRLLSFNDGGVVRYYLTDKLGSTRLLTDPTGAVTDSYLFSAYGLLLQHTGSSANSFLFAGEQRDSSSGLTYLRARYYDPATGSFLSPDPFSGVDTLPHSLNKYLYALANPVNRTDPSGNWSLAELGIVEIVQGLLKAYNAYGKVRNGLDVIGRTIQAIGGVLTVQAEAAAFMDSEKVGYYLGGYVHGPTVREILGKGAAVPLALISFRMFSSLGKQHYIPFGESLEPHIYAAVWDTDPLRWYNVYIGPSWYVMDVFPKTPLDFCRVGGLVHEFAHLATKGKIDDLPTGQAYGWDLIKFSPPLTALRNADNYRVAVQGVAFGGNV